MNGAAQFLIDGDGWGGRVLAVSVRHWPIVQDVPPPRQLNHTSSGCALRDLLTRAPVRSTGKRSSPATPAQHTSGVSQRLSPLQRPPHQTSQTSDHKKTRVRHSAKLGFPNLKQIF